MSSSSTRPTLWPRSLTSAWLGAVVIVGWISLLATFYLPAPGIADFFVRRQDMYVAAATAAFLVVLRISPANDMVVARLASLRPVQPGAVAIIGAMFAGLMVFGGWFLVMKSYPLSTDEFFASFDAAIFREGQLFATLPVEWRALRFPLQPQYIMLAGDGASWSSAYLPLNAMVQAFLGHPLTGAIWVAVSVAALYGVTRRLWPERPDASLLAILLLVTSSQFLLMGMTRYAMSAHLALNLVWLWLFLREGRVSQLGAVVVGFAATGLHQIVFHPLFVAPFVLELWLQRRWRKAGFYTVAYLAIGLFWLFYWRLFFPEGSSAGANARDVWLSQIVRVLQDFGGDQFLGLAKGLLRFLTWQNPATPALALLAFLPALRSGLPFRPMALGVLLLLLFMLVTVPDQGHGWGYRYLHGFLGSICLLAVLGWIRMTKVMDAEACAAARVGLGLITAFSLIVLLPWRAVQAGSLIHPYAEAAAAIRRVPDVDVVVVDASNMFYAPDLVRNDPRLRGQPKVVDLVVMEDQDVRTMCARHRVAVFDRLSGSAIPPSKDPPLELAQMARNRQLMAELGCGDRRVMVRTGEAALTGR